MLLAYALQDGTLRHVDEVDNGLDCGCVCPLCGEELVAKQGDERVHHFAHKSGGNCIGAVESALHLLSKDIYAESQYIVLPEIQSGVTSQFCCGDTRKAVRRILCEPTKDDILSMFAENGYRDIEATLEGVRPDVVVETAEHEIYFIEIFVTHKIDAEKRQKLINIGIPTVEISLKDQDRMTSRDELSKILLSQDKINRAGKWIAYETMMFREIRYEEPGSCVFCSLIPDLDHNDCEYYDCPFFAGHASTYSIYCAGDKFIQKFSDIYIDIDKRKKNFYDSLFCPKCHTKSVTQTFLDFMCSNCHNILSYSDVLKGFKALTRIIKITTEIKNTYSDCKIVVLPRFGMDRYRFQNEVVLNEYKKRISDVNLQYITNTSIPDIVIKTIDGKEYLFAVAILDKSFKMSHVTRRDLLRYKNNCYRLLPEVEQKLTMPMAVIRCPLDKVDSIGHLVLQHDFMKDYAYWAKYDKVEDFSLTEPPSAAYDKAEDSSLTESPPVAYDKAEDSSLTAKDAEMQEEQEMTSETAKRKAELEKAGARCRSCDEWHALSDVHGLCALAQTETSVLARCDKIALSWRVDAAALDPVDSEDVGVRKARFEERNMQCTDCPEWKQGLCGLTGRETYAATYCSGIVIMRQVREKPQE